MNAVAFRSRLACVAVLSAIGFAPGAHAATFIVTNLADSGAGSLRQAIVDANGNAGADTITFAVNGTVVLTTGELAISDSLTIQGPGAALMAIDGNAASRAMSISGAGTVVTVSGVTVRNSSFVGNGGGIRTAAGTTLTLNASVVSNNAATANGGGISAAGALIIAGSTLSGNTAGIFGGGIAGDVVTLTNSTVSGNSAGTNGGGLIFNTAATLSNATLSGNASPGTGGLSALGAATLTNIIIANSAGADCSITGGSVTATNSLVEDATCGVTAGINGNRNGDPALGALADNGCVSPAVGGCVPTMALLPGSPAIDAGNSAACAALPVNGVDQRGFVRIAPCDMGAFEFGAAAPVVPPTGAASVPTLSEWGVLGLAMLIVLSAAFSRRRPGRSKH